MCMDKNQHYKPLQLVTSLSAKENTRMRETVTTKRASDTHTSLLSYR